MYAFDRQTDGQTDGRTDRQSESFLLTRPPCIQCSAVKTRVSLLKATNIGG